MKGEATYERVGQLLRVTRERARQIERDILADPAVRALARRWGGR